MVERPSKEAQAEEFEAERDTTHAADDLVQRWLPCPATDLAGILLDSTLNLTRCGHEDMISNLESGCHISTVLPYFLIFLLFTEITYSGIVSWASIYDRTSGRYCGD